MQRNELVVGDPPTGGGHILPYTPPFGCKIDGHQVAVIGGRVYCDTCKSVGTIAKAGKSRRRKYLTEVALEGDLCVCRCPKPRSLLSTLQSFVSTDDSDVAGEANLPLWASGCDHHLIASKLVDEQVTYLPEAARTENICPNMANPALARLMLELRDEAVSIIGVRLQEIARWDGLAKDRILEWFGDPGFGTRDAHLDDLRSYLRAGMQSAERVLRGLEAKNFVRWVPGAHKHVGCADPEPLPVGLTAAVCKPDLQTRTISIALPFCGLRRTHRIFGRDAATENDSQLSTLIHEVTHFKDVFDSTDDWYRIQRAREQLAATGNFRIARANADSIVGYITGAMP
jgi:uncharacterized Zn-binding protein involved in type VI secretion